MHNAPSVSYPVGRCALVGWVLGGLSAGALVLQAGAVWAWWPGGAWVPWRWAVSSGVCAFTLAGAWWHWWRAPVGWLIWAPWMADDPSTPVSLSAGWWWGTRAGAEGQAVARVQPMVLTGSWALLRVTLAEGRRAPGLWVWAQARTAPERWLPLRRAVARHAG